MSLTNVKLPGAVIADLYRKTLIGGDEPIQAAAITEEAPQPVNIPAQPAETMQEAPAPANHPAKAPGPEPAPAAPVAKPAGAYKMLGNNKQHISVIVQAANEVFLPEAELQFLTKMLGACKLNLADVAIVNHATSEVAIDKLKEQLSPRYVLLFGVEPGAIQLPISFPPFKEQPYAGTSYLFAPALQQLNQENEEAKQMKRKLWDCLKRMFV